MSTPALNAPAPEVDLDGWADGGARRFRLSEERGHPVVLAFYPGDETLVCTRQMCAYSHGLDAFADLGAQVWGISVQDVESHRLFAEHRGLRLPLLADPDKTAVRAYGVDGLVVKRSVFVVDDDGLLRWSSVRRLGLTFPDAATLTGVLRGLSPAGR